MQREGGPEPVAAHSPTSGPTRPLVARVLGEPPRTQAPATHAGLCCHPAHTGAGLADKAHLTLTQPSTSPRPTWLRPARAAGRGREEAPAAVPPPPPWAGAHSGPRTEPLSRGRAGLPPWGPLLPSALPKMLPVAAGTPGASPGHTRSRGEGAGRRAARRVSAVYEGRVGKAVLSRFS